jgi:hypothetical protein
VRRIAAAVAVAVLLGGCSLLSPREFGQLHSPACEYKGDAGTPVVVLEAQAVPSATMLPCVKLLPTGWTLASGSLTLHNGEARFGLTSDRAGTQAVTVVLQPSCDVTGAIRVPSDEPGTRRYQTVGTVETTRFTGLQIYVFDGGCVTYRYDLTGEGKATPISEVTQALGFVPRAAVAKGISDWTGGRYQLDPPGEGS